MLSASQAFFAGQEEANRANSVIIGSKSYGTGVTNLSKMPLSKAQATQIEILNNVSKATGASIVVADGLTDEKGFEGSFGAYKDGTVYINVAKVGDGINYTAGHELVHFIKGENAELYKKLEKVVVNELKSSDSYNFDEQVQNKINQYWKADQQLTRAEAIEEIVAESCFDVLSNEQSVSKIVKTDWKLARKIKDWLSDFIARLKEVAEKIGRGRPEYKALHNNVEALENISEAFYSALDGIKNTSTNSDGESRLMLIGKSKDGISKYESDFPKDMPIDERIEIFKNRISTIFNLGAVSLKTDTKKIFVKGDAFTEQKNIFGDKGNNKEYEAKVGALYDYADILENSTFVSKNIENSYLSDSKPKNKAHKNVKYWYKFKNDIIFEGTPYRVIFNIRDKGKNQYEYLIEFHERKKKILNDRDTATKSNFARLGSKSSNTNISQSENGVNSHSMQETKKDTKFMLPTTDSDDSEIQLYRNQQYISENKALKKQVEILKKRVEFFKNELTLTNGNKLSEKAIESFAKTMRNKYESQYDLEKLKGEMTALFEFIANNEDADYDNIIYQGSRIAKNILQQSSKLFI